MAEAFGAESWTRQFGNETPELWFRKLGRFTLAEIARGLDTCVEDKRGYPPTLGQLLDYIKAHQVPAASYSGSLPAFPPPGSGLRGVVEHCGKRSNGTAVARAEIAKMQAIVGLRGEQDSQKGA